MEYMERGAIFIAGGWVLCASVWRIHLMQWSKHQCLQIVSYFMLSLWAASHVLGMRDLDFLGVIGVAVMFYGGRKRWLSHAPADVARTPEQQHTMQRVLAVIRGREGA